MIMDKVRITELKRGGRQRFWGFWVGRNIRVHLGIR